MEGYSQKQAMCDTFLQAVEQDNFKHGAFRGRITKATTFEDAINIFLTSSVVSNAEKKKFFKPMRHLMAEMVRKEAVNPGLTEKLLDMDRMTELLAVFTMDKQSQYSGSAALYDAPMLMQTMGSNNMIAKTITVDKNGIKKEFTGGEPGIDPALQHGTRKCREIETCPAPTRIRTIKQILLLTMAPIRNRRR